jgi:polysaccharide export outer membrane protein
MLQNRGCLFREEAAPEHVVRASRLSLILLMLCGLAASGCMRRSAPVTLASPGVTQSGDLDSFAYNRTSHAGAVAPVVVATPVNSRVLAAQAYAPGPADQPYRLDAGDKLRIVVYGQEGLTNTYAVDAGGSITMPLIGAVSAKGLTPAQLAASITAKLKNGYIREPYVAAEVESYRPFYILGEVAAPGQYPYVPSMSIESAIAIAGGFTPRAQRSSVELTRNEGGGPVRVQVPLGTPLRPGDTILVGERWF